MAAVVLGVVAIAAIFLWPQKKVPDIDADGRAAPSGSSPYRKGSTAAPEPFDAFAGGFPVPPLPGQTLPSAPRRARRLVPEGSPSAGDGPAAPDAQDEEVPRG